MRMREEIRKSGKLLGYIENNIYFTYRDIDKHLFKKYNAWGISEKVLDHLEYKSVKDVIVITDDKNVNWFIVENEDVWLVPEYCMDQVENWII